MIDLPHIKDDNIERYVDVLLAVMEYSSPGSDLDLRRSSDGYRVTITPGDQGFRQSLIDNLLSLHRFYQMKIVFSSSLQIQKNVSFNVKIEEYLN